MHTHQPLDVRSLNVQKLTMSDNRGIVPEFPTQLVRFEAKGFRQWIFSAFVKQRFRVPRISILSSQLSLQIGPRQEFPLAIPAFVQ